MARAQNLQVKIYQERQKISISSSTTYLRSRENMTNMLIIGTHLTKNKIGQVCRVCTAQANRQQQSTLNPPLLWKTSVCQNISYCPAVLEGILHWSSTRKNPHDSLVIDIVKKELNRLFHTIILESTKENSQTLPTP